MLIINQVFSQEEEFVRYKFGNATLRSSAHTLRYSKIRATDKGPNTGTHKLPPEIRQRHVTSYDTLKYDLRGEVLRMLHGMDTDMIGDFHNDDEQQDWRLENFIVPPNSLLPRKKSRSKDGKGEVAQSTLTDRVINDSQFHFTFDKFVCEEILPTFRKRLIACGAIPENEPATFHYQ
jgi:hypothetical protein